MQGFCLDGTKGASAKASAGAGAFGIAAHVVELEKVSREAEAAGDVELAEALVSQLRLIDRHPLAGVGNVTLVLRSGRRIELRNARAHIQRRGSNPAAGGSLATRMEALAARCRRLATECDLARIARILASDGRGSAPPARAYTGFVRHRTGNGRGVRGFR